MREQLKKRLSEPGARVLLICDEKQRQQVWKSVQNWAEDLGLNVSQQNRARGQRNTWLYLYTKQEVAEGMIAGLTFTNVIYHWTTPSHLVDRTKPMVRSLNFDTAKMSVEVME